MSELCAEEEDPVQVVVFSPVVFVWSVPHTHSTTTTAFACIFQCFFCQQVQQSCNSSSASADEPSEENHDCEMVKMTKSKTFQAYLPNCHRTYSCIHCRAHLANHDELISKTSQTLVSSSLSYDSYQPERVKASTCFFGDRTSQGSATHSEESAICPLPHT
ncbi:protein yippee-like 1 isoform X2 [Ictalurus furcatus]|uniref:protein yippee-like 1 isoform X2 n=1 Tax=Ictalurus furcatus TaxID=66913 RepID=UPI002350FBFF|nr:protein yippee-like 1 isoform X2 [Ictalurus furcatus]